LIQVDAIPPFITSRTLLGAVTVFFFLHALLCMATVLTNVCFPLRRQTW